MTRLTVTINGKKVFIDIEKDGIGVGVEGFSNEAEPHDGIVVYVDLWNNDEPVTYVWSDINDEEPTRISLIGASEAARNE